MTILSDPSWENGTAASRVLRIVFGVYLLALLAGLWRGRGRR